MSLTPAPSKCILADAGLAVSFLSLPFQHEREFFERELRDSIFQRYRHAVASNFSASADPAARREFEHFFYVPAAYYLFGRFDVAVLTLVDDFEFSARTLHPFDPMMASGRKSYFENFFHKVITGPTPRFGQGDDGFVALARRTFLAPKRRPLFAVALFKLNNSLLIGCGVDLLRAAVSYIQKLGREMADRGLDLIVLESYAWHEITVLVFADAYALILELIARVREINLGQLAPEPPAAIFARSLLAKHLSRSGSAGEIASAHVFAESETTLGFDFSILDGDLSPLAAIPAADRIDLTTRWYIKPGHLSTARRLLLEDGAQDVAFAFGRGDLLTRAAGDGNATRAQIESYVHAFGNEKLRDVVLQRYTIATSPETHWDSMPEPPSSHPSFTHQINHLKYDVEDLRMFEDNLRTLGTPKILALKLLNMYANFNDGLLDRNLYGFFAELLPFMDLVFKHTEDAAKRGFPASVETWCRQMQQVVENFDLAYRNRFHNSHRLGEITDFNMDFKGGIQQLVTAYDGAYKAIGSVVGNHKSFVCVGGAPSVFSTTYESRLNYFHLFQPEAFLTVATHEAAWCCFNGRPTMMPEDLTTLLAELKESIEVLGGTHLSWWAELVDAALIAGAPASEPDRAGRMLLKELVVDRLAYVMAYDRDPELLWYWYLGYFSQVHLAYESPHELNVRQCTDMFLRLALVCDADRDALLRCIGPFRDTALGAIFSASLPSVVKAIGAFGADPSLAAWRQRAWDFCERCAAVPKSSASADADSRSLADFEGLLKRGEVVTFAEGDAYAPFRFVQRLFHAYRQGGVR